MINEKVCKNLIEVAKKKGVINYSDLNNECQLGINFEGDVGGKEIGGILGKISEYELKNNRPPISVLVGSKSKKPFIPSRGFFKLMDKLRMRKQKETDEQMRNRLMNWCYEYWEDNKN